MLCHDGLACPSAYYAAARRSAFGRPVPTSWGQLRKALTSHDRDRAADKLDAACWAPHAAQGNRRTAASITAVYALVLDFDDGADVPDVMALFPTKERCAYSTYSAQPGAPRCRLVLPLAVPVAGALWAATMRQILKDIGQDKSAADPKCIDPSRLYLLPCRGPVEVADHAPGDLIDVGEYVAKAEYEAELARIAADHLRAKQAARAEAARRWAAAPQGDGYSAAAAIRQNEQENGWSRVPIVGVSSHALGEFHERAISMGMDSCITKPLQLKALQKVLQQTQSQRQCGGPGQKV